MGRIIAASVLVFLVVLTVACSSESPTLQLASGTITEDEFRTQFRQSVFLQPSGGDIVCSVSRSNSEEMLSAYYDSGFFIGRSVTNAPVAEDSDRAIELLIEECDDLTS